RRHTRSYGDWSSDMCSSDLPLQRHDGRGGLDLAGLQLRYRLRKGHDEDADIFGLVCQPVQAASTGSVDVTAKQSNALGRATRARSEERRVGKGSRARAVQSD